MKTGGVEIIGRDNMNDYTEHGKVDRKILFYFIY